MKAEHETKEQVSERPPVIVVMGHIDHGKSKLLDYIRKSHVVEGEAGGITQHISAYEVKHKTKSKEEKRITFLDTPGHEAFSGMRARGAKVADIAILVVAADDGVKAQTMEAYKAIKDAGIPCVVAINKIDKPDADQTKTIQGLIENEIYIEGYGGDVPYNTISAKDGTGVEELLDTLLLVSEIEELKGDPRENASGVVIETHIDAKRGISATLVIKDGTLRRGMYVSAEGSCAPVRILEDFTGANIESATFSSPIQIRGFDSIPPVGATFNSYRDRKDAESASLACSTQNNDERISPDEGTHVIPVILKADVVGTSEAILKKLQDMNGNGAYVKIVHSGIGNIAEGDVKMAGTSENAYIIGFNVVADSSAKEMADRLGIHIKTFNIIYELLAWFEDIIKEETPREDVEERIADIKILKAFNKDKGRQVLGGKVLDGYASVGAEFRVERRDEQIGVGKIAGLQQQRAEINTVEEGNEFGMSVDADITIVPGDRLITFRIVQK